MKSLVIAEKPSVARDIARVLGANQKNGGILEGKNYVVTWALGHLVTLADPEEYDRKYEKWEMATLPMLPKEMKLVVIRQTGRQFSVVKTQLFRKDIGEIIIATDAGREGELVARWILEKAGCHKPIKRLWISSVTDKAIKEGFANLKDGHDYDNLYREAVARAEADWLVGMNGTRALTCKYNAQLSCGRVQTPTLAMIAKREEEIRKFVPKEYYGISLETQDVKWTWRDEKTKSFRTFSRERAEQIKGRLENAALEITSVEKKAKKTMAPGLYDLTTLQREANLKYGFSAKETLNIMQRLYENHKVLTYPRTDSRYIGKDIVPTIKERLKACGIGPYRKLAGALMNKPVQVNGSFVDDKRVSDHHAIIPTEQFVQLDHMTNEERKIYDVTGKLPDNFVMPEDKGIIVDISGGGLRLFSKKQYDADSIVNVSFPIQVGDRSRYMKLMAKVVMSMRNQNSDSVYDSRLQFVNMQKEDTEDIVKYVFAQQRMIRKKERGL